MARWFDETAKTAARRDGAGAQHEGMTRRTVLTRGAVVAGVAWTAPLLMQSRAYAGASACASGTIPCFGTMGNTTVACCAAGTTCNTDGTTGAPTCAPAQSPGGTCGNQGNGNGGCNLAKCNGDAKQCNGCAAPNVCGGESAFCANQGECASGLFCTPAGSDLGNHCRRKCTTSAGCNTGQTCDTTGFCAQLCGSCQAGETCGPDGSTGNNICSYNQHA